MTITSADCRMCGACCVSGGSGEDVRDHGYADVTDKDVVRLSSHVRKQLHRVTDGAPTHYRTASKQLPSGAYACLHLRGTPGQRCSCAIYTTRPEICRDFRVGGAACRAARLALACRPSTNSQES